MRNTPRNKAIVARPSPYDGGFGFFQALGLTHSSPPTYDKDKYKLSIRIQNYNIIKSYLDKNLKPNDCLTLKQFGDKTGYTIRDIVDLVEQFGTPSQTTAIYKTLLKKDGRYFWIASKTMNGDIQENFNQGEAALMERITKELIITELSKHFVIMYKSTFCEDSKVEKSRRLVNFNELCDGDIRSLLSDTIMDKDTFYNILFQCVISLATFHNMIGYTHNDTHNGNFLYQTNNEEIKGYYHYTLGDTSFYLKHCPYNICLYDFGHSKELRPENLPNIVSYNSTSIFNEYHLLIYNFNEKDENLSDVMDQMIKYFRINKTNSLFKILFFEEILRLMKIHSPEGMILDVLPDGAVALNEKPFIISNHKAIGGSLGSRSVVKYKSIGEYVHILYKNKKLKRCVYMKTKGRGKYCKNQQYIYIT